MRALLDINVLIALLDEDHSMHAHAGRWLSTGLARPPISILLAVAVRRRGCFVSFDSSIPRTAIKGAEQEHLVTR